MSLYIFCINSSIRGKLIDYYLILGCAYFFPNFPYTDVYFTFRILRTTVSKKESYNIIESSIVGADNKQKWNKLLVKASFQ